MAISFDRPEENRAFAQKFGFPYRMLSDVDRTIGERYETKRHPQEKNQRRPKRRTYLIDPEGLIRKAYRVGDVATHPDEVLADLRAIQEAG
jgi:thioredoxin-dependent peroxiredoxin